MSRGIDRREFIGTVAASAVAAIGTAGVIQAARAADGPTGSASAASGSSPAASAEAASPGSTSPASALDAGQYPPVATGLRGQYPGSFEAAHAARDGSLSDDIAAADSGEHYDVVIVGAGISGLSAAHFFRQALGDDRKILILDNHDDFGGHAKRNEFHHEGRMYVGYGGTMSIETPFPYSYTARALIDELGIDVLSYRKHLNEKLYDGLTRGVFFDREHFRGDRLVAGAGKRPWPEFFADAPLTGPVRADLTRLHTSKVDYLPGLTTERKIETLKRISYQDYLITHARLLHESLPYFNGTAFRNNMRADTCPAYTAARYNAPGFEGVGLPPDPIYQTEYEFHFPDGNASIARLLVSRLIPGAFDGPQDQDSIVSAMAHYEALDTPSNPTRLRLKSTVVRVENIGPAAQATRVRLVYMRDGKAVKVTADNAIMACFNNIIPHIVKDFPAVQGQALAYASKVPMQYTNVLVRNWIPWQKLGVQAIEAPNGYHTYTMLDIPMSIGKYACPTDPREPIVVHMIRNPNKPGLPRREQNRAGRADMLATPYSVSEQQIRDQLGRMLGPGGFDAKRDVLAMTVNRWPHGYAYTYDTIGDPDVPEAERPHVIGRKAFGRITIANADSAAAAFTNAAIDQAQRAVQECLSTRGLV